RDDTGFVERLGLGTAMVDPSADLDPVSPADKGRSGRNPDLIELFRRSHQPRDLKYIAKAARADQADPRTTPLDRRVRRDRGPVHEIAYIGRATEPLRGRNDRL